MLNLQLLMQMTNTDHQWGQAVWSFHWMLGLSPMGFPNSEVRQ